jgi:hypothetical protein
LPEILALPDSATVPPELLEGVEPDRIAESLVFRSFLHDTEANELSASDTGRISIPLTDGELQHHFIPGRIDRIAANGFLSKYRISDRRTYPYDETRQSAEDRLLRVRLPHEEDPKQHVNAIRPLYAFVVWQNELRELLKENKVSVVPFEGSTAVAFFERNAGLERRTTRIKGDSWEQETNSSLRSGATFWGATETGVDQTDCHAGGSVHQTEAQIWAPPRLANVASFGVGRAIDPDTLEKLKAFGIPIFEIGRISHPKAGYGFVRTEQIFAGDKNR